MHLSCFLFHFGFYLWIRDTFLLVYVIQQNEYYSCDATYRNWLQIELETAGIDVSNEEKQRANLVAAETLSSSMALLLSEFIYMFLCIFYFQVCYTQVIILIT